MSDSDSTVTANRSPATANNKTSISVVVLISGGGTNLQAIIDGKQNKQLAVNINAVISNRPDVKGLERAKQANIATEVIDHKGYAERTDFDQALMQAIDNYQPDLVVLAGFMRILTPEFVNHYLGRLINIHPSLLPKYPGLHTHQRALDAGDNIHGVTVHFVTPELDGGPAIIQAQVPVHSDDNADQLAARVLQQEHIIYPQAIQWFAEGRLQLRNNETFLDNEPLPPTGHLISH